MGRECDITGKGTMFGNTVPRKGLARRKGGGGQHIGTKAKRTFRVNLLKKRFSLPGVDHNVSLRVSARALRSITKIGLQAFIKKHSNL